MPQVAQKSGQKHNKYPTSIAQVPQKYPTSPNKSGDYVPLQQIETL
jgi:hypothetical protein